MISMHSPIASKRRPRYLVKRIPNSINILALGTAMVIGLQAMAQSQLLRS
jgi:hypothetical protein